MARSPTSFGRALREGLRLTSGNWRVPALGFAVELAQGALFFGVQVMVFGLIAGAAQRALTAMRPELFVPPPIWFLESFLRELASSHAWLPAAGAAIAAVLIGLVLRLFWIGYAVRAFTGVLREEPATAGLAAGAQAFPRVVTASLLLAPLWLGSVLWRLAALGSTGILYGEAMASRQGGTGAAFALALAMALAILLELGVLLVSRLALIRAASADVGPVDALRGAALLLASRLGVVAALTLVFGVARMAATLVGESGGALVAGGGPEVLALLMAARAIGGVFASLLLAGIGSVQLGAFTTLDLDARGLLPEPPAPPEPVVEPTEPVLETVPVLTAEAEEPVFETEPIFDTAPAEEPILETEPAPGSAEPDEEPGGPRNPAYAVP